MTIAARRLLLLGLATSFGCQRVSFLSVADDDQGSPQAVIERTRWDFGTVSGEKELMARFPVTNAGRRRLVLVELDRSCDCVAPDRPEIIVAPGESTVIPIRLDAKQLAGAFEMIVRFTSNDAHQPTLEFRLCAKIL